MKRTHLIAGAATIAAFAGGATVSLAAGAATSQTAAATATPTATATAPCGPGGRGPWHGGRGPGGPLGVVGPRELLADAAKAIGISSDSLADQLRDGKSLESIAKAKGKTLAEVRSAVKSAATARLDAALKAKKITQAQRDAAVARLDDVLDHLGDGPWRRGRGPDRANPPSAPAPPAAPTATATP